jgi:hypothetical protein
MPQNKTTHLDNFHDIDYNLILIPSFLKTGNRGGTKTAISDKLKV